MKELLRVGLARRAFALLFVLGLSLQIGAIALRGMSDMLAFKSWALTAVSAGVFHSYGRPEPVQGEPESFSRPDYPPLSVVGLWAVGKIAVAINPTIDTRARSMTMLIKLPLLLARVLVFVLMLLLVFQLTADPTRAWTVALATWLNPALILNGSTLGYLDPLCWAPGVAALVSASRGRHRLAGVLLAIAMLTKHQGVLFGFPVLALAGRDRAAMMRVLWPCALVVLLVCVPFIVVGSPEGFIAGLQVNITDSLISGNALNFWWLVTLAMHLVNGGLDAIHSYAVHLNLSALVGAIGFSPRVITRTVIIGATLWMYARVSRHPSLPAAAAMGALSIHTYFVLGISVHENHLVNAIPLAALTAVYWPRYWRLFWALTAVAALNQYLFYGFGRDFEVPLKTGWFWIWTAGLSAANVALLGAHVVLFARRGSTPMTRPRFRRFRFRRQTRPQAPHPQTLPH